MYYLDKICLKNFLDKNENIFPETILWFYSLAISWNDIIAISLLNLYVREHNIILNDRIELLNKIYYVDWKTKSCCCNLLKKTKKNHSRCDTSEPSDFEDLNLQLRYIHQYWNMIEIK